MSDMGKKFKISRNFLRVTLVSLIFWFSFGLRGPVVPLYIRSLGASMAEMGIVSMFGSIGWAVFEPSLGLLSDKIGRKKILILGTLGAALITFLFTLAKAVWNFFLLSFLLSATMSGMSVTTRAFMADALPPSRRGRNYGIFMAATSLGSIPAPFLGGYLAGAINYYVPLYAGALIILISFFVALTLSEERKLNQKEKLSKGAPERPIEKYRGLKHFATAGFILFFLTRAFQTFTGFFSMSILPIYVKESPKFRATEAQIGIMLGLARVVSSPMQLVFGALADRIGRKPLILIGLIFSGFAFLGYTIIGGIPQLYLLQIFVSLASVAYNLSMMVLMIETTPSEYYGTAMGLYGLAEDFGGIAGPLTLGPLYDKYGVMVSAYCTSMVFFVGSILAFASFRTFAKKPIR